MKSFLEFLEESLEAERAVTFDYSNEPRSAIGAVNEDRLVKTASILFDGEVNKRQFRLCVIYVNPRRDDGRIMDVFPEYSQPACSTAEELKSLNTGANDPHGIIAQAIADFEKSPIYLNLQASAADPDVAE